MLSLSIIGCGHVAKILGYLWHKSKSVIIKDVVNQSLSRAEQSVEFIGAGNALCSKDKFQNADIFAIGCGDDQIETCLELLLSQDLIKKNTIVFHFSGAKSSLVLNPAKQLGAHCASLHPVKSFADPSLAIQSFSNTYCGLEGDDEACLALETLVKSIKGNCFYIKPDNKLTYHAASVFASNYLVALQELSIQAFIHSGVERELAMNILEPIVKETTENIFQLGTAHALTGPIARGDHQLVTDQFEAIRNWSKDPAEIYRLMGQLCVDLSDRKEAANKEDLEHIRQLFKLPNTD